MREPPARQAASHTTRRSSGVWKNSTWKAVVPGVGGSAATTSAAVRPRRSDSGCSSDIIPLMPGASNATENQSEYGWQDGWPSTIRPPSIRPFTW
ncbi:hypothetical protein ACFZDG_33265 [Kitasatospora xanthocidica]|uniref:hypothetical protein n=1 Tax=Kitasatospora xanthocidica TaxID=83382 RepID=UPI0036E0D191